MRISAPVAYILLYTALYAAFGVASPFWPRFFETRGLSPQEIGIVLAAAMLTRLLAGPTVGMLADRAGSLRFALAVCTALAAAWGGAALDAAFAHLIAFNQGRIKSLEQFTDTARWHDAAGPLRTVLLDFEGGVATLRLNRPDKGNAIDERMAADLAEAATQIAERPDVRAVLIAGNGPNFTVGGDLGLFAGTAREQLPNRLRRMIDSYHLAIERLTSIDAPVVAAVRGGTGGGGLGLLYVADIVVAADDARFALGYGALGLTADGGNTWFLPRMVGMRRAQELFLLNRRLTAQEALAFGLVTRLAPDHQVDSEAASLAAKLAAGPTGAFGAVRRMLRQSFETGLSDQLDAEKDSIVIASNTDDAQEGISAFVAKRRPNFRGS